MTTKEITWNSAAQKYYGMIWSDEQNRYIRTSWTIDEFKNMQS